MIDLGVDEFYVEDVFLLLNKIPTFTLNKSLSKFMAKSTTNFSAPATFNVGIIIRTFFFSDIIINAFYTIQ